MKKIQFRKFRKFRKFLPVTAIFSLLLVLLGCSIYELACNIKERYSDASIESSLELSKEFFEESYEDMSEEPSKESVNYSSEDSYEEVSEQSSKESSKEVSEATSTESSEETSEQSSEESSEQSEESSEETSEETSEESSEEVADDIPLSIPSDLKVGYIVYDAKEDKILSAMNENEDFRTGCTIKAAYVLWLLQEYPELHEKWDDIKLSYFISTEGTGEWRETVKPGTKLSLSKVVRYCIVHSDNDAYLMLTSKYGYAGFNKFMEDLGISIRLGINGENNFTSATAYEQLVIWKEIVRFCSTDAVQATFFKDWLYKAKYSFIEDKLNVPTWHMSGWAENSGTVNDCAVILDSQGNPDKIMIILTSDGIVKDNLYSYRLKNIASQLWQYFK